MANQTVFKEEHHGGISLQLSQEHIPDLIWVSIVQDVTEIYKRHHIVLTQCSEYATEVRDGHPTFPYNYFIK